MAVPTDAASTTYGDGVSTCGARTYVITDSTGAVPTWVTAHAVPTDPTKFTVRVKIDTESYVAASPHTMNIKVTFTNYPIADDALHPTKTYPIAITVTAAACDCSLISWNEPKNLPLIMSSMVVTTPAV